MPIQKDNSFLSISDACQKSSSYLKDKMLNDLDIFNEEYILLLEYVEQARKISELKYKFILDMGEPTILVGETLYNIINIGLLCTNTSYKWEYILDTDIMKEIYNDLPKKYTLNTQQDLPALLETTEKKDVLLLLANIYDQQKFEYIISLNIADNVEIYIGLSVITL